MNKIDVVFLCGVFVGIGGCMFNFNIQFAILFALFGAVPYLIITIKEFDK